MRFGVVSVAVLVVLLVQAASAGSGQSASTDQVSVLLVTAHPDDDAAFTGVVYQITHQLDGSVDLVLVTDGSGGFRYATLAEQIYGLELTKEEVARQYLPTIRKRELMAGGAIASIRSYFFLDQLDDAFTRDPEPALTTVWDSASVRRRLVGLMQSGEYDFVFALLPFADNHGHHKAATILALEATKSLAPEERPAVLGGFPCAVNGQPIEFAGLDGYPITNVASGEPIAQFDRTQKFGFNDRLDFQIVGNWVIAEHKSQGAMQLNMSQFERECYWFFDVNEEAHRRPVTELFERLRIERP